MAEHMKKKSEINRTPGTALPQIMTTVVSLASQVINAPQLPDVVFAPNMSSSSYVSVDLAALAAGGAGYLSTLPELNLTGPAISLLSYHPDFASAVGASASARLVSDLPWEAFHEAGVYSRADNSLYVTSNFRDLRDSINVTVVSLDDYSVSSRKIPGMAAGNGGTTYHPPGSDRDATPPLHVYCDQGGFDSPSQLLAYDPAADASWPLLTSFLGRDFSSVNDVRQHPETGDLWFTDADYGYFQHFRPEPTQPKQVYRFDPSTGAVQAVADGFVEPNGLEFSPDLKTLYVSDTGAAQFEKVPRNPATVYAFDVVGDGKRLANRRMFAFVDTGFPDGVHCDAAGNVWAGAGDGVHVWNPEGALLGKIFVGEESNNFAFAPGKVFVFSNSRLWVVEGVEAVGREVCKDFGRDQAGCA